jgi:high affinity sulfate transporter 1
MAEAQKDHGLGKYFPILSWLPKYKKAWLRLDFIAGLTVVALLVPEGMAYAELAGVPPQTAFYAAPAGLILYAIFGSSKQLIVAVSAAVAVMSAAAVGLIASPGSDEFLALTAMIAIMVGVLAIIGGLLRLGRIAQFFSESVLTGFVFGLALVIAVKQLPKLFGQEAVSGDFFERLWDMIVHLPESNLWTVVIGISSLILMILLEKYVPRIPAALVALIVGIVMVAVLGLEGKGVEIVGKIPAGLAPPKIPEVSLVDAFFLLSGAAGIVLVSFAEAIGPARSFASEHGYEIDANQELLGLGAANLGAGLFQGFPIGSSLSKSAANDSAGAKSQMSAIIAALLTIIVALFLTSLFYNLPEATLGAVVIVAVTGMMNVPKMKRLYHLRKWDFALAMTALLGVLIFDVLPGLLIAVGLSLFALIFRASTPKISLLGRKPHTMQFGDVREHPNCITTPGLLVIRVDENVFFANAESIKDEIKELLKSAKDPVEVIVLDLEMANDPDVPAVDMLDELNEELETLGITLMLTRIPSRMEELLQKSGTWEKFSEHSIHTRVIDAVFEFRRDEIATQQSVELMEDLFRGLRDFIPQLLENADDETRIRLLEIQHKLDEILGDEEQLNN